MNVKVNFPRNLSYSYLRTNEGEKKLRNMSLSFGKDQDGKSTFSSKRRDGA